MKIKTLLGSSLIGLCLSQPASALNIVLTNDDGWDTHNIKTLFTQLKSGGHDVVMAAPCIGQSGKGGAVEFLKAVNIDRSQIADNKACIGETDETLAYEDFSNGTPVMAALYGIDVLAQEKWSAAPDLLISGPNEGNNLGYLTNNSGTLGAANVAIARGIPAIAVSAHMDDENTEAMAKVVVDIVAELIANQKEGQALLPAFTGLNVNTPADSANHQGYVFSRVGWNSGNVDVQFVDDMSQDQTVMGYVAQGILAAGYAPDMATAMQIAQSQYAGKGGVSIADGGLVNDNNANSEGVLLEQGYVTISTIEANVQATSAKTALMELKLNGLIK
ncbi:5'/3'-nucleotidase SurE [Colwellia echini]|uniref:5'-nucleotidase n=1 Tax=Colwellia echini TaxID=1982103 RepID=A0ABY3MY49_9GAMM|nr:5'/3'-nucleotidase SurE [Colwellia echini]TYK66104.1 acid phosphatase [Colwellia echini]